ncbi:hypothetical protein KIH39_22050 [Telmatocola sphagniphila]|uniref:Uncharacterized protein n=1 Tax=Telmatocola sphagniphila TaxID=1123043 RepID=A0A8E6B4D0_9BACT|nr:hypothetical protein [Telmatocola sphagniphila]QVL31501.1 hypothetical protein KIH39_22050 [Telmatocola sphagniphila]
MLSTVLAKSCFILFFSNIVQIIPTDVTLVLGRYLTVSDRFYRQTDRPNDELYSRVDLSCTFKSTLIVEKVLIGDRKYQNKQFIVRAFTATIPFFFADISKYDYNPSRIEYIKNPHIGGYGIFFIKENNENIEGEVSAITTKNELSKLWCPICPYPTFFDDKTQEQDNLIVSSQVNPFVDFLTRFSCSNVRNKLELLKTGIGSDNYYISTWSITRWKYFLNQPSKDNYIDIIESCSKSHPFTFYFLNEYMTNNMGKKWSSSEIRIFCYANTLHRQNEYDQSQLRKFSSSLGEGKWTLIKYPHNKNSSVFTMDFDLEFIVKLYRYLYQTDKKFVYPPLVLKQAKFLMPIPWGVLAR